MFCMRQVHEATYGARQDLPAATPDPTAFLPFPQNPALDPEVFLALSKDFWRLLAHSSLVCSSLEGVRLETDHVVVLLNFAVTFLVGRSRVASLWQQRSGDMHALPMP